jgi:hypothetical protein
MAKLIGNLRIFTVPASEGVTAHFAVEFIPYSGRLRTQPVTAQNHEELVALLTELKFDEDEASRWAGRIRTQGMVLVSSFERTDAFLKEHNLLL